ncbi:hypothetical protein [Tabrizicola sp.]|uniref:hypothetical protein n=1 Tax=Tabrizicola sp. TaxID=2005166 RepID=UPI003F36B27A
MVPTTGAVLHLCALVPRPGLPHGAAFAQGDYRPLALSADYRALAGPEGPIARYLGAAITPHELRLSGAPDGGRSWEVPVALAHLLLSKGWTLAKPEEPADLTLWATGAVDLDMRLLPGDYGLERKVDVSKAELAAAGKTVVAVLPPGSGQDAALARLNDLGIRTLKPEKLDEVLSVLTYAPEVVPAAASSPPPRRANMRMIAGASAIAAAFVAVAVIQLTDRTGPDVNVVDQPDEPETPVGGTTEIVAEGPTIEPVPELPPGGADSPPVEGVVEDPEDPANPEGSPTPPAETPAQNEAEVTPPTTPSQPGIQLAEVRVAEGGSCRSALFDPARRTLQPVMWGPEGFAPTPADPTLCGIVLSSSDGSAPPSVQSDPPGAFVEASGAAGTTVLFLREGVRNVVYTFPDPNGGAGDAPIRHQIVMPDP